MELAETLKISKKRVGHIVHGYLDMRKLCAKWLPRLLTIDQNQQRVDDSEQCLAIFYRNKDEFFRRYITMDVTWLLCFTTLQSPIDSQPSGLNAMNRIQTMERHNGQLVLVLRDARGIIFIDYLEKGQTINRKYYWSV
jgi:hypothetical protein